MRSTRWIALAATAMLASGCEYALIGVFGAPPVGPWGGKVYDARTGLPVGGATAIADWAPPATSGNDGTFTIGNLWPAGTVTVARAGYVTQTRQGRALADAPDVYLEPRFAAGGAGNSVGIGLAGMVTSAGRPVPGAMVTFTAGPNAFAKSDPTGRYQMLLRYPTGNIASGMIGGGPVAGGNDGSGGKPLSYAAFDFRPASLGPGDPSTTPANANLNLVVKPVSGNLSLSVASAPLPNVQAEVNLDFGLLGQILVFRGLGGDLGNIPVPQNGLQYQVTVTAADDAGSMQSISSVKVAGGSQVQVDFLAPPQPLSPPNKTVGNSTEPTFAWTPVPGAALYAVDVFEGTDETKPIWQGLTDATSIKFPFNPRNLNDAALKRSADPEHPLFYTWNVTALEQATADALLSQAASRGTVVGRESVAKNWTFSL